MVVGSRSTLRPGVLHTCLPQCISCNPSGQNLQFLLKLSPWISSSLRGQNVEVLSNLPQQTSSSILYTLRAPPRYWIATAMDIVEPQRPDSGRHVGIESDCRGRSGTIAIHVSGEKQDNKIYKHERAKAKPQPNTSSESLVVEERREQTKEIREKREERKWPQTKFDAFLSCPRRAEL